MTPSESHRVVLITGANEGIGYHLLTSLIEDGYRVTGLDINGENFRSLQEEYPGQVRFLECDVTNDSDVEAAVETSIDEWCRIDVLVNNAGIFDFALFEDQTLGDMQHEFEVNSFGYIRLIHAVLPHMRERGDGIIHNVSSGAGLVGHPTLAGYAAGDRPLATLTDSPVLGPGRPGGATLVPAA